MTGGSVVYTRRRLRDRLKALMASDSVRNFIWIFYLPMFAWGWYGSVFAYPINLIYDTMGQAIYDVWVWTPIPATGCALVGLVLRHGGSPADQIQGRLLRQDFLGLWMQFGGHACMFVIFSVYEVTGVLGAYWGQPIISVFGFSSYTLGVFILAVQCLYKIRLGRG